MKCFLNIQFVLCTCFYILDLQNKYIITPSPYHVVLYYTAPSTVELSHHPLAWEPEYGHKSLIQILSYCINYTVTLVNIPLFPTPNQPYLPLISWGTLTYVLVHIHIKFILKYATVHALPVFYSQDLPIKFWNFFKAVSINNGVD